MGQALKGQLIVTNRRLVYIRYHGGKYLTAKGEDYSGRIDEGLRNEGSIEVPLNEVIEAKADRVWGTPYFRLRYRTSGGESVFSFVLTSSMNLLAAGGVLGLTKAPYSRLAEEITRLKEAYIASEPVSASPVAAAAPSSAERHCPSCGASLRPGHLFCGSCGKDLSR